MKLFNKYNKGDNFRRMGFHFYKTTFGFGFSFGKPLRIFPVFILIINQPGEYRYFTKKLFDLSLGWFLFSFRVQILKGTY